MIAAGFADFALISFHFQKVASVSSEIIPVLYAVAMATGAIAAFVFGRLLDKIGFTALLIAFFVSAFLRLLCFWETLVWLLSVWSCGESGSGHRIR